MTKEFFYISNLLSLSRFLLTAVCAILLSIEEYVISILVIVIIWITDLLDGFLARKRNEISEMGKIIDPVADKTAIFVISLILVIQGIIPLWFFIIIAVRDLLILIGGLIVKPRVEKMPQSNMIGKLTVFFIGLTLIFFLLQKLQFLAFLSYPSEFTELLITVLLLVSITLIVFSIISYLTRFLKIIKQSTT